MNLLVSDYDGTFKPYFNKNILEENISEINKLRSKTNKFAISTSRSFTSITKEIEKYNIPYDYLICNNGEVVLDKNKKMIFYNEIEQYALSNIEEEIAFYYGIDTINYLDPLKNEVYANPSEVIIKTSKIVNPIKIRNLVEREVYGIYIHSFMNRIHLLKESDKKTALSALIKYLKNEISITDVYTVGNGYEDFQMLKHYNGYKVPFSSPYLWMQNIPLTPNVKTLAKKIR